MANNNENTGPVNDAPAGNAAERGFLIVGIGASAGGIKALKDFFKEVPAGSGLAYVVILHLSPEFESKLAQILQTECAIPVAQISEDQVRIEPDHVYITPPNRSLTVTDGILALSARESYEERRAPIDVFFRTLADSHDGSSVAVILSGTGADGSMGIGRIKENGGVVLVQDPDEADYGDMPRNAIAKGMADFVLPVSQIPHKIIYYRDQRGKIQIAVRQPESSREEEHEKALGEIFSQLRIKTGHDFSNYKRSTILRRIERRMNVREITELPAYAAIVQKEKEEALLLLKDLLISVTNFFRDKTAFEALETEIMPKLFAGKNSRDMVRIWVTACASGEEAYSIAMLCAEYLITMAEPPMVQIFATDIDNAAIGAAREGFYSNADVADVSPERLRRFFSKDGTGFRVKRELRETVLFARHNIIRDPPFSRLDLATCRNLLIYLNRPAVEHVFNSLHFALNRGGYLFLGSSETIDNNSRLYSTLNREHSIFQNRADVSFPKLPISEPLLLTRTPDFKDAFYPASEFKQPERMSFAGLHQLVLELYAPPSVLVNARYDILHVSKSAGRYLQIAGEPSLNLLNVVRPEFRLELRGALYSASNTNVASRVDNLKINLNGYDEIIEILVKPVLDQIDEARGFLLVLFQPQGSVGPSPTPAISLSKSNEPIAIHLEEALLQTRSQFKQLSEQYEVQTEEFKASNEELQAINEELRSAAEELETSKEELQSVNEELTTVNQELKIKIEELSQANNDFKNLINATNIGTIFLDRSYGVNLFTPSACAIFNLKAADFARPLSDITNRLSNTNIMPDLERVMSSLQPAEREVETIDGATYLMRILPYRTADDHINGVIATFVDITGRKQVEEALRSSEERMRAMFNQARAGLVQTDFEGRITMVNQRFCAMLDVEENELTGRAIKELLFPEDREKTAQQLEKLFKDGQPFEAEHRYLSRNNNVLWLHDSASLIRNRQGSPQSLLHIEVDISKQKLLEAQKDEFIGIASHELKTPITSIKSYAEILQERYRKTGDEESEKVVEKLSKQVDRMVKLIRELLDTTGITTGTLQIHKKPFDLIQLITEVTETMQATANKHTLKLKLEQLPVFNGDRARIEQVLTNLIDNAIKYSPEADKIVITSGIANNTINICVKDFGIGLSGEATQSIFDRFYREESRVNMNSLGLGLFISMEIAKLHGGTIKVESSKQQGAIFCLLLPLQEN